MAELGKAAFIAKYNDASTGRYKSGQTRGIGSDDHRELVQDIADSFPNSEDVPMIRFGGNWAFPGSAFPTSTYAGTIYIATADHGSPGDADYVQSGQRMLSTIDGADAFNEYSIW